MNSIAMIKKVQHRCIGQGGFAIRRRNKKKVTYAEFKLKLKDKIIDDTLYSAVLLLLMYGVVMIAGFLLAPGPELGVLLLVLACHAIWTSAKGSLSLKRDLTWLS